MAEEYFAIIDGDRVQISQQEFENNLFVAQEEKVESVTMRQAKIQLSRAGLLGPVNEFIAAMEGQPGEEARIEWEYATTFRRDHSLLNAIGGQFNLSEEQIDTLFTDASKIE